MRERIAIGICLLALCVAAIFSCVFAWRHNSESVTERKASASPSITNVVATNVAAEKQTDFLGRSVFDQQKCTSCHSIAGQGNPRYPLDGVGGRLSSEQLIYWITGTGPATNKLSAMILRRKARYEQMPSAEMNSLIEYLSTLQKQPHSTDVP